MEHVLKSLVPETKSKKEARQLKKLRLRLSLGQQPDLVPQPKEKFRNWRRWKNVTKTTAVSWTSTSSSKYTAHLIANCWWFLTSDTTIYVYMLWRSIVRGKIDWVSNVARSNVRGQMAAVKCRGPFMALIYSYHGNCCWIIMCSHYQIFVATATTLSPWQIIMTPLQRTIQITSVGWKNLW